MDGEPPPGVLFPRRRIPPQVDWLWQKAQIDAAVAAGVKKVVLVSSMGGTQIDNFLNTMGAGGDVGDANILLWKRKAEMHLVASGVDFTIIHPGGLLDKPGAPENSSWAWTTPSSPAIDALPRADVAETAVRCLTMDEARNLSFDLASREEGEGAGPTRDFAALLAGLDGKTADYSLPKGSPVPLP